MWEWSCLPRPENTSATPSHFWVLSEWPNQMMDANMDKKNLRVVVTVVRTSEPKPWRVK